MAYIKNSWQTIQFLENLNISLGCEGNVIVQSQEEHQHEEEAKTTKEVPEVMMVVEDVVETVGVDCFGLRGTQASVLNFGDEKVHCRQSKEGSQ